MINKYYLKNDQMVDLGVFKKDLEEEQMNESQVPVSDIYSILNTRKLSRQLKIEELRSVEAGSDNNTYLFVKYVFIFLGILNVVVLMVLGVYLFLRL